MNNHIDKKFMPKSNTLQDIEKELQEKINRYNKNKTSKKKLHKLIYTYTNNLPKGILPKLVLCHGKIHTKKFKYALLVDYEVNTDPDIVMDIWNKSQMDLFPAKSFDIIRMEHCSLVNMNDTKWKNRPNKLMYNIFDYNQQLWENCKKLLKPNGYIENNYITEVYYKNKYLKTDKDRTKWASPFSKLSKKKQEQIIQEVISELNKLGYSNVTYKFKYNKIYFMIGL